MGDDHLNEEAGHKTPPQSSTIAEGKPAHGLFAELKRRKVFRAAFAFGAVVPTIGFLVLLLVLLLRPGGNSPPTTPDRSIAVLPFANLSANAENAYFAGGMHEDLLTQLARLDDLEVASKTSVLRYRDHPDNLRVIAGQLGVRYIVEGSVQRVGEDVRITVQLIDAATDKHLWAENFDRRLENIFALQSEISREIAQRVQARISPEENRALNTVPTAVATCNSPAWTWRTLQSPKRPKRLRLPCSGPGTSTPGTSPHCGPRAFTRVESG